jgi:DNA-binding NarL/FixJ family response regulator
MDPDTIRVSVVEDEPTIRASLETLLASEPGLTLAGSHGNGEEALDRLPGEAPDVVLMDISMPGMDGNQCVRELWPRMPGTLFLMYTMHDEDERVFEALRHGATGYILKSSGPEEILSAIRDAVKGGAPMSMAIARRVIHHMRRTAPGPAPELPAGIGEREMTLLALLAEGLLYKEIGDRMGLTVGMVKQVIHKLYRKLQVQNRTEAVNRYLGR